IACEGNPAQCFIRRNLSSSAAAISLPSRSSAAEESAWKAFRPRIIIALLTLLLTSFLLPAETSPKLPSNTPRGHLQSRNGRAKANEEQDCYPRFRLVSGNQM